MTNTAHGYGIFRKLLLPLAVKVAVAFLATVAFIELTDWGTDAELSTSGGIAGLSTSAEIAGLMALSYILAALSVLIGTSLPNAGAKLLNVEDADELREMSAAVLQRRRNGCFRTGSAGPGAIRSGWLDCAADGGRLDYRTPRAGCGSFQTDGPPH